MNNDLLFPCAAVVLIATLARVPKDTFASKSYGLFLVIASLTIEYLTFTSGMTSPEKYSSYVVVASTLFFLNLQAAQSVVGEDYEMFE